MEYIVIKYATSLLNHLEYSVHTLTPSSIEVYERDGTFAGKLFYLNGNLKGTEWIIDMMQITSLGAIVNG